MFELQIGRRIVASQLIEDGKYPVYSANVREPFGNINELLITDFSRDSVLWGIDGDWMVGYIPHDTPFYPTDHCGVIRVLSNEIKSYYLSLILDNVGALYGFSRTYRASTERVASVQIPLPPIDIQNKIVSECKRIDEEYNTSRMTIETYRQKIADIFHKLDVVKLGGVKISELCKYTTVRTRNIVTATYVTTDNMLQDFEGIRPFEGTTEAESAIAFKKGDVLLSNIRPYLKKLWLADRDGSCSPDVLVFRVDSAKVYPEFFYYSLRRDAFIDFVMNSAGTKGIKMPRGNKDAIPNYTIALPSLEKQAEILSEIKQYEMKIEEARSIMNGYESRKQAVLSKYLMQ